MLICVAGLLSGCRYSDTLLEVIIDPATGILEAHASPEYREKENAPEDPNLASIHLSENENLADQSKLLPVYKEDAGINGQAIRRNYETSASDNTEAVEGNISSEKQEENTQTSEDQQETQENSSGEGDTEEEQTSDEGDESEPDKTGGRGGEAQVYAEGSDDLPDVKCLAAKGQYALITQMLAGKGGLAAADASWINDMRSRGLFLDEGLEDVAVVWDAEGNFDYDALIASRADGILVDGVDVSLSSDVEAALTAQGIDVIYVPTLGKTYTQDADIVNAVKVTGQVLSGLNSDASFSTADMVQRYIGWHDDAINGCLNANGGYSYKYIEGRVYQTIYQGTSPTGEVNARVSQNRTTTALIDSWTSASSSSITANRDFGWDNSIYLHGATIDLTDGVGLSASTVGGKFILSDYYLQTAGIMNNAYPGPKPVSSAANSDESLPYAVTAGKNEGITARPTGSREIPSALWYPQESVATLQKWKCVGDADFPGVVVRDAEMVQKVANSASKSNGLYNVGQPYMIWQIPQGVAGNWFDGTVESFFTSLWAYDVFAAGGDTANVREWLAGFYKLFYRTDDFVSQIQGLDVQMTASCPVGM